MIPDERIDRRLREAMATSPAPVLSARFDERLSQHLPRRHLTATRRAGLTVYCVAAVAISVGLMLRAEIDWRLIVVALGAPVALATVACRRCVTLALRAVSAA